MHGPSASFSATQIANVHLRLTEAVTARRRALSPWPRLVEPCLQRLLGRRPTVASQAAEAHTLLILAGCYGPAVLEAQPYRSVVDLIALQGAPTVVRRTLWGVGFADDALQAVLLDVIPEFKAMIERYPSVFGFSENSQLGSASLASRARNSSP